MIVSTNHIDIDPYWLRFEEIFSRYSPEWVNRRTQYPHRGPGPSVILGNCGVWDDLEKQVAFVAYVAGLAKVSESTPYTISTAIVLEDAIAGYYAYLLMDSFAKAKLDALHNTLFSGAFGKHMNFDMGETFVAGVSVGWFGTLEEATLIVNDLNRLPIHIAGQISSLIISGTSFTTRLGKVVKSQIFEEFKLGSA